MKRNLSSCFFIVITVTSVFLQISCSNNASSGTDNPKILSSPKNVFAILDNNKTRLSWDGLNFIDINFRVERSLANDNNFIDVSGKLPGTQSSFIDPMIKRMYGDSFEYRVVVSDNNGSYTSTVSNIITPSNDLNIIHYSSQFINTVSGLDSSQFGFKLEFNSDGTTVAIATKGRSIVDGQQPSTSAAIELITRSGVNQWDSTSRTIMSNNSSSMKTFSLSPDGNTLAIGEITPKTGNNIGAGLVKIFTKDKLGNWNTISPITLVSPKQGKIFQFGSVLKFSPDSKTLAVAETGTSIIRFYNNVLNTGWATTATTVLNNITVTPNPWEQAMEFSPDGNFFALADMFMDVDSSVNAGVVALFSKNSNGVWETIASKIFFSKNRGSDFNFGQSIAFSPDSTSIAIGEARTNSVLKNNTTYRGGNVQLFTKFNNSTWKSIPDHIFVSSASRGNFYGTELAFNRTGKILAIGDRQTSLFTNLNTITPAGVVAIYLKDNQGIWNERPSEMLASNSTVARGGDGKRVERFGNSFAFNPTDDTLFVGEPYGITNRAVNIQAGFVNVYDTRTFE